MDLNTVLSREFSTASKTVSKNASLGVLSSI